MCQEYNGWTNRETWCVNLWLDNDQEIYETIQGLTREEIEGHDDGEEINAYHLGERIEEWVNALFDYENVIHNRDLFIMMSDIGSLYRVNWREIAESKLEETKEETKVAN